MRFYPGFDCDAVCDAKRSRVFHLEEVIFEQVEAHETGSGVCVEPCRVAEDFAVIVVPANVTEDRSSSHGAARRPGEI